MKVAGSGKAWLACAPAHQVARGGFSVLYVRAARRFDELQVAHGGGSFARRLLQLDRPDLLVIDDFAISPIGPTFRVVAITRLSRPQFAPEPRLPEMQADGQSGNAFTGAASFALRTPSLLGHV